MRKMCKTISGTATLHTRCAGLLLLFKSRTAQLNRLLLQRLSVYSTQTQLRHRYTIYCAYINYDGVLKKERLSRFASSSPDTAVPLDFS